MKIAFGADPLATDQFPSAESGRTILTALETGIAQLDEESPDGTLSSFAGVSKLSDQITALAEDFLQKVKDTPWSSESRYPFLLADLRTSVADEDVKTVYECVMKMRDMSSVAVTEDKRSMTACKATVSASGNHTDFHIRFQRLFSFFSGAVNCCRDISDRGATQHR
jgi:hypothetical protein